MFGGGLVDLLAQRDRAAAALERLDAAIANQRAAQYLQNSYRDHLTGAYAREPGRERLGIEMARAQRGEGSLVIAFLDVVGLKKTNDEHGHLMGDLVLAAVGSALLGGLRAYDIVVRYGGDEFVCALPGTTAQAVRERLDEIAAALNTSDRYAEISCGIVVWQQGESLDAVIDRADHAMYESRRHHAQDNGIQSISGGLPAQKL